MVIELILILPILGILGLVFFKSYNLKLIYSWSVLISIFSLILSFYLYFKIDKIYYEFQLFKILNNSVISDFSYTLGLDHISLLFIILTNLLIICCILYNILNVVSGIKEVIMVLFLLQFLLLNVFLVINLFLFYIFFESVLIPMFLLIGIWGSRQRKIHAMYYLFYYTLFGSVFMLLAIIYMYNNIYNLDLSLLLTIEFPFDIECLLFLAFFIGFGIKIPLWPFHIWLPEAHVESPTAGSVILAGILLKLGSYGMYRFLIPIFPKACIFFYPLVSVFGVVGIIYCSLIILRQLDLKKIIAYSSVVHMSFVVLGLFSPNIYGISGSILLMLNHGIVSSALFLCVGVLYERYHTRLISYYGGLIQVMPLFGVIFFFFMLANISLPGTSSFIGEILVLIGIFQKNFLVALLFNTSVIFSGIYGIWLYNRVIFGHFKYKYIKYVSDLTLTEYLIFYPLIVFVILFGIYPIFYIDNLEYQLLTYVVNYNI